MERVLGSRIGGRLRRLRLLLVLAPAGWQRHCGLLRGGRLRSLRLRGLRLLLVLAPAGWQRHCGLLRGGRLRSLRLRGLRLLLVLAPAGWQRDRGLLRGGRLFFRLRHDELPLVVGGSAYP
ncbi:hypothetical protein [Allorhizocola rhizosphaerae]|uniref:hypothetical protein n=1 Tax=Allorhizocola rhizosphaerae TaxID=1872709 RepID=UPI0013C2B26C|nr:hypothetical protein [Allorhizocola rhizosphaerae]